MRPSLRSLPLWCILSGCGAAAPGPRPLELVDYAPSALASSVELRDEKRKGLTAELPSRIELDLRLPEDAVFNFAIGASSRDRPTLLAPVVFRVLLNDTEVFRASLRARRGTRPPAPAAARRI